MKKATATQAHIQAIQSGEVTKTNVIGLRKALNGLERKAIGWSASPHTPSMTEDERDQILEELLPKVRPRVVGELHVTGVKLLKNKRYRKQLEPVADIVADLTEFRLVGFDFIGRFGQCAVPVYRAYDSRGHSFPFCTIPWQAGGNGPQIMSGNYW